MFPYGVLRGPCLGDAVTDPIVVIKVDELKRLILEAYAAGLNRGPVDAVVEKIKDKLKELSN